MKSSTGNELRNAAQRHAASAFAGKVVRLGAGSGFSGDRIEPAAALARSGAIDYLVFECLAERTIGLAQQQRAHSPDAGYDPLLDPRLRAVMADCHARGVRIVSNMGAANPLAAARHAIDIARELGLAGLKVAVVLGDDVLANLPHESHNVSANAYVGAAPIVEALADGAHIVITGRVSDAALFMAPLIHEFSWAWDDWNRLGRAAIVGHLLECAAQVCGGYFADPGFKQVPDLAHLGFPIGTVNQDGNLLLSKLPGTGGRLSIASCTEQLLYEVHDPSAYLQPDVVADLTEVTLEEAGEDRVLVRGGKGHPRPATLKVSVCHHDGFIGEGQISYAGPGAAQRGQLALDIVRERLADVDAALLEQRFDLIGINAMSGVDVARLSATPEPLEVRVRVAGRAATEATARQVGDEVEALYTNGPAAGGGAWKCVRPVLAVRSAYVPREVVRPSLTWFELP